MDPSWVNFCPDLQALQDAVFETDDDGERFLINDLMSHFRKFSSWPRDFYKSGDAIHWLSEYALIALGQVVKEYDDVMESRRLQAESLQKYSKSPEPVSSSSAPLQKPNEVQEAVDCQVVDVKFEPQNVPIIDLISEDVLAEVGADEVGDEVVKDDVNTVRKSSRIRRTCKAKKGRKGKTKWVPSVLVLRLSAPDVEPVVGSKGKEVVVDETKRKGKEKVVDDGGSRKTKVKGVERLNLGGSDRRTKHGVPLDEPKLVDEFPDCKMHDLLIEDDDNGWQKFKVVEEYDSGISSGCPDIPWSPPSCDELNPDEHIFVVMKKEPSSP